MEKVEVVPAKRFFVEMLTRDIELIDAILDLVDNCLDGATRLLQGKISGETPYKGFEVEISFDESHFMISDNCGGIPRDVARKSAFRMGRHDAERDKDIPTVGVYGIGMKRAIFKMGEDAAVFSSPTGEAGYVVNISNDWMRDDSDWHLPLSDESGDRFDMKGTKIVVNQLRENVKRQFMSADFKGELFETIATHFSYIISKGLVIKLNQRVIEPNISIIRFGKDFSNKNDSIAPYIYKNNIAGVDIEIAIGFYRALSTDKEEAEETDGKSVSERAGITVICNDRVVLYNDKTHLTGWGEAGVPRYHTQFIAVSGVVVFQSKDPSKLPLKTTKRGVDSDSEIYSIVKDRIREGLKTFTDFTNKWKKAPKTELAQHFKIDETDSAPSVSLSQKVKETEWTKLRRDGGKVFKPNLPLPKNTDPIERIVFTKKRSEVHAVSRYLFDDIQPTRIVGEYCFDLIMKKV